MEKNKTIITLGTGQLGLMLDKAAKKLNIPFRMLSHDEALFWIEQLPSPDPYLVTFEQEYVDPLLLAAIQKKEVESFPSWPNFMLLRNKKSQKEFLAKYSFPTSPFVSDLNLVEEFLEEHPEAVLKAGQGGYDGKGVWFLSDGKIQKKPWRNTWDSIELQSPFIEKKIPYDYEIAAVVCRSAKGENVLYPTVKSIQVNGICTQVEYSKEFATSAVAKNAGRIAEHIANELHYVGVLAVEMFVDGDTILVNEIAPRVHNSGHFTIDVCEGTQFENHLRAGLGLPLRSTNTSHPAAVMVNLLWPEEAKEFAPLFSKLTCGPEWPENVKLHWYGKSEIRTNRKMGHFTVYGQNLEECKKMAQQILASRWA